MMDSSFYISMRGWSGEELPEDFIKFSFEYSFSEADINILRSRFAHTSLGFRWHYYSEEKIFISRGGRCFYLLQLNPKEGKHNAVLFLYDGMLENHNCGLGFPPKVLLLKMLDRWLMRKRMDE